MDPADGIKLGTLLFTMVEPHKGHEVEYNRWYERDHFYAGCMIAAWNFAGNRFVSRRQEKALRYPAASPMTPDPQTGTYLALYWVLKDHHDDWNRWSVDQVQWLHANGRMFKERTHVHTVVYEKSWTLNAADDGVPIELALDHPFKGLVVNVGEVAEGSTHADVERWFADSWMPSARGTDWCPEVVVSATPLPLLPDAPPDVPRLQNAERRFLQLHFCKHDPADTWEQGYGSFGEQLNASGVANHLWTSPFIPTIFGTDTYTKELW